MRLQNTSEYQILLPSIGKTAAPGEIIDVGDAPGFENHPFLKPVADEPATAQPVAEPVTAEEVPSEGN